MSSEKRYYIAYGSNLNVAQMVRRCPNAVPIGTAVLEHNTLYFRGSGTGYYLTIEPKIGRKMNRHLTAMRAFQGFTTSTTSPLRSRHLTKKQRLNLNALPTS